MIRSCVAAVVLVATFIAAPMPATAAGADALSFSDGSSSPFGPNAVVRIDGRFTYLTACSDGVPDFVYPVTDVYLVRQVPASGDTLHDAGGGPPNTIVSPQSVFVDEIIGITGPTGTLDEGTYSVVYDTCQDGVFDDAVDTVFPDVITVDLPTILPSASSALVELKLAAEEEAHSWVRAHALFETIEKIQDIPDLVGCMMSPSVECGTEILVGEVSGDFSFTAGVSEHFKELMVSQARQYAAIAADPPDPEFRQHTTILPIGPAGPGAVGRAVDRAAAAAVSPMAGEEALGAALLRSIERYQGAQAAGDAEWAAIHARETADLSSALRSQMGATRSSLSDLRTAVATEAGDLDAAISDASDYVDRVRASGFTPDERRQLYNLGLSAAEIGDREAQTRRTAEATPVTRAAILADLDAVISAHVQTASALESAGRGFAAIAEQIAEQTPLLTPSADAGGPYLASRGVATTLNAGRSATPPGTAITGYAWDTDADGEFDDSVGPTPSVTFGQPGSRVVGLQVTNSSGHQSVSYATVNVATAGQPPHVNSASPATGYVVVKVGSTQTFALEVNDPDHDALTYSWSVDGVDAGSSVSSLGFSPTVARVGVHVVEARASDGSGAPATSQRWTVAVIDVDADVDGWTRTPDCNDADPAVSPAAIEHLGNEIDDDCDTATPDAPPGGLTGSPWSWGSNDEGQVGIGTLSGIVRPPVELSSFDDVVQVGGTFRVGYAVRASGGVLSWGSNFNGELGDRTTQRRLAPGPVAAVDGLAGELAGVTQVSGGGANSPGVFALARRSDGTAVSWGFNSSGQLGDGSAATFHPFPVRVLRYEDGLPLTGVKEIEAGREQGYAVMANGTVRTWGYIFCSGSRTGTFAGHAVPLATVGSTVRQVSSGTYGTLFRMADGSVRSCGTDEAPPLGRQIDDAHPRNEPHVVDGLGAGSGVVDVSEGLTGGVALKSDGTVWTWGLNGVNTGLGLPAGQAVPSPRQVPLPPGPPVVDVDTHLACQTLALRADGSVLVWGCDTKGSTGLGTAGDVATPTLLPVPDSGVDVSATLYNGLVLARDNHDASWDPPADWLVASVADADGDEADPGDFVVTLSEPAPRDVHLSWSTAPISAQPADLSRTEGSLTIPAGSRAGRIAAPVADDAVDEPDETYMLRLTDISNGIQVSRGQATGTIRDDDTAPEVSVEPLRIAEGSTSLTDAAVLLSLSRVSGRDVSVDIATADESAQAPDDYAPARLTATIPAGKTTAVAHLAVHGDRVAEPDESLVVRLSSPVHASLGDASAKVTLLDDDPLALQVKTPVVTEGDTGITAADFEVSLSPRAPAGTVVTVPYTLIGRTASIPDDVLPLSGVLEFRAGDGPQVVTVQVRGDEVTEPDELIQLALGTSTASGDRLILPAEDATGVIMDDDDLAPDTLAPTITGSADRAPNSNGWYNAPVTITWTATDDRDGPLTPPTAKLVGEGEDQTVTSGEVCDQARNCTTGRFGPLSVDTTAPSVTITGPTAGTRYSSPSTVPPAGCTASDALSGLTAVCTVNTTVRSDGSVAVEALANDKAGNVGRAQLSYTVGSAHAPYPWTSFLQPINDTAHDTGSEPDVSVFKAGSTIPVKFRLVDSTGKPVTPSSAPRWIAPVKGVATSQPVDEDVYSLPADGGQTFRWDTDHWQYNWQTNKNQTGFYWRIGVALDDGTTHVVYIALK